MNIQTHLIRTKQNYKKEEEKPPAADALDEGIPIH